jgi:hypothetical protein
VAVHGETAERLVRGGIGSAIVHAALAALLAIPGPTFNRDRSATGPAMIIFPAPAEAPDLFPQRDPDLPFADQPPGSGSDTIPLSIDGGPNGADFTIDLARIRDRRNDLFPFVTWNLEFLRARPWGDRHGTLEYGTGTGAIAPVSGATLMLRDEKIQSLVDRAFSRRHRWSNLQEIVALTDRYHGDRGDLAELVRRYVQQNVPQPYEDWSDPDPVYWITVMLAADDAPLVEFVARYLRRYPANRVSTELLFLLDVSAESSCDVLSRVMRAGTAALPLTITQLDNPDAFDLAVSLADAYRGWVRRNRANVAARCIDSRVAILRRIIDTSPDGYGISDARFRLGKLLWTARRQPEAVEWWSRMTNDGRDQYAQARKALLGAIADGAPEFRPGRIDGVLVDEARRWRVGINERLDQFGVRPTEF